MAIKNTESRVITATYEQVCQILRSSDFQTCLDATFVEEALLPDAVEFRYQRLTSWKKYGRNYFVKLKKLDDNRTEVAVTTQSRKVTVLWDIAWKDETDKIFNYLLILLRNSNS